MGFREVVRGLVRGMESCEEGGSANTDKLTEGEGGVGVMLTMADKGGRGVGEMLTMADKGRRGGSGPPQFLADICEQPLEVFVIVLA